MARPMAAVAQSPVPQREIQGPARGRPPYQQSTGVEDALHPGARYYSARPGPFGLMAMARVRPPLMSTILALKLMK